MTLLILGVFLWWAAHLFKSVAPARRQSMTDKMGQRARGLFAGLILASVVMMVFGYRWADFYPIYQPLPGIGHLNNLLMFVAIYLFGVGGAKGLLASKLRHPMLLGFLTWSGAHLLVNGDLASVILFGGLGAWALVSMLTINTRDGVWTPAEPGPIRKDLVGVGITAVIFAVIAAVHVFLGKNPFLGTYG